MTFSQSSSALLDEFVDDVSQAIARGGGERVVTAEVAKGLEKLLASDFELPPGFVAPHPDRYVMYPVYVDPEGEFSIAAAVWNVGQKTPVHGHETWGVVGIYSGVEREVRYVKPAQPDVPLSVAEEAHEWQPGEVTVCCTTDDDVHEVSCSGSQPCIGIHVYGANIGSLKRRSYDPETGSVSWFVSEWSSPGGS